MSTSRAVEIMRLLAGTPPKGMKIPTTEETEMELIDRMNGLVDLWTKRLFSGGTDHARCLVELLNELRDYEKSSVVRLRDMKIEVDHLCVRSRNALDSLGIKTIGELARQSANELLCVRNLGQTSLNEIRRYLAKHGLSLVGEAAPPVVETNQCDPAAPAT